MMYVLFCWNVRHEQVPHSVKLDTQLIGHLQLSTDPSEQLQAMVSLSPGVSGQPIAPGPEAT